MAGTVATAADYDCMIEARQNIEIRSPVEAIIESVKVRRGDRVTQGQVLVTLQSDRLSDLFQARLLPVEFFEQLLPLAKMFAGPKNSDGKALYADWPWVNGLSAGGSVGSVTSADIGAVAAAVQAELDQRARLTFTQGFKVLPAGLGQLAPLIGAAALARSVPVAR